jgi:hypothetical protein
VNVSGSAVSAEKIWAGLCGSGRGLEVQAYGIVAESVWLRFAPHPRLSYSQDPRDHSQHVPFILIAVERI